MNYFFFSQNIGNLIGGSRFFCDFERAEFWMDNRFIWRFVGAQQQHTDCYRKARGRDRIC